MKKLFIDIKAFKTEQLDRSELKMLDSNNFIGLLENDENGFNQFISELNEYLDKIPSKISFEKWYSNLSKFIDEINNNNKIDFNKLDIYQQIAEKELLEYDKLIHKTKPEIFKPMNVNHTQLHLENIINKRKKIRDDIVNEFNKKFKVVNDNIKKKHFDELMNDINIHIDNAIKSNYDQGMEIMTNYIKPNYNQTVINQITLEAKDLNLTATKNFLKSEDMNENIVNDFNIFEKKINQKYKTEKIKIIALQEIEINKYKTRMENYVLNFIDSIRKEILLNDFNESYEINKFLVTPFSIFKLELISNIFKNIDSFLSDYIQYSITFYIIKDKPTFTDFELYFEVTNNKVDSTYLYFKQIYDLTKEKISELINSPQLERFFNIKKIQLLKQYTPDSSLISPQLSTDISKINAHLCKFYMINNKFFPNFYIKKKFLIKQACCHLIKNKLILKVKNHIIYNGWVAGSYKELFMKVFLYNDRLNFNFFQKTLNNGHWIFMSSLNKLNIIRENYSAAEIIRWNSISS